jgi:hypothetical protein
MHVLYALFYKETSRLQNSVADGSAYDDVSSLLAEEVKKTSNTLRLGATTCIPYMRPTWLE